MGLDRVLANKEPPRDLTVAHALRDQFKSLKLAACDAQVLSFSLVRHERFASTDRDFRHNDPLPRSSQLEAKPDTQPGKQGSDQPTVDFHRMLDNQKAIL